MSTLKPRYVGKAFDCDGQLMRMATDGERVWIVPCVGQPRGEAPIPHMKRHRMKGVRRERRQ